MREIVFDTETTGTEPLKGDRVVEIGCVELMNHVPTGKTYHTYLNPERPMSEGAFRVHGLSDEFLADKPLFASVAAGFAAFIAGAKLIAHNASFDVAFIDMEFGRLDLPGLDRSLVIDTLVMARRKHPGASNSLDALCTRYGIDSSKRTRHGALLDSEILADVYIELIGGKQADLGLAMIATTTRDGANSVTQPEEVMRKRPLAPRLSKIEIAAHQDFIAQLGDKQLWKAYPELLRTEKSDA
jgi:DNA polymerase III subunit epsilon